MQTYRPRLIPRGATLEEVISHLNTELQNIHKAANAGSDGIPVNVLYAAPSKPQIGWHYVADGTSWNPGGGAGTYRYDGGVTFTKGG